MASDEVLSFILGHRPPNIPVHLDDSSIYALLPVLSGFLNAHEGCIHLDSPFRLFLCDGSLSGLTTICHAKSLKSCSIFRLAVPFCCPPPGAKPPCSPSTWTLYYRSVSVPLLDLSCTRIMSWYDSENKLLSCLGIEAASGHIRDLWDSLLISTYKS